MLRLTKAFNDKAKIAYLTAGHITEDAEQNTEYRRHSTEDKNSLIDKSVEYFMALVRSGVNILEVGVPFSDPVADGPVIQEAMDRAIKGGIDFRAALEIIYRIRKQSEVAIIVFSYFNPIGHNLENALIDIKESGADGVLIVDLPLEENDKLVYYCDKLDLAPIMVAAPSTPLVRLKLLSECGKGFLYYACRKGTTGIRNELSPDIIEHVKEVRSTSKLPVAVGFGVSNSSMVNQILALADGCVIGSYFVKAVLEGKTPQELEIMAKEVFSVN